MRTLAAEDRLTAGTLATLVGIEVGDELPEDELPEDLVAAGCVIYALLKDPTVVTLEVPMDHACLERTFEAREQLRLAHVDRSFKSRFHDPGDP